MSLDEFLDKLSRLRLRGERVEWVPIGMAGAIRCVTAAGSYCPITAVCKAETGVRIPPILYDKAAEAIGLAASGALRIANASDNRYPGYADLPSQTLLRIRLLKACRLEKYDVDH